MDACTEEMKTEFVGVPSRPESALDIGVGVCPSLWDAVRPYLAAHRQAGSLGRIGHYEILEVLGQGGFGIVVKALDEKLQRFVAIKILSPLLAGTSPPRQYFLREARSAAKVQHENVVRIYGVEESPLPYIVMEYIAGQTLQRRIDAAGPLEAAEVVRLGRQMALGLAAAHAQGLVHRDIKPANILLEGDEAHVKITDFGIARTADDASMTQSSLIVGTPMYMSPEQANGESLDHRSDLFSLGSVLYTMACGRPPFRAGSGLSVLRRVSEDRPRPIPEVNADVPAGLCAVINRLQAKDPVQRYASANDVADQLAACLEPARSVKENSWRSGIVLAACVLVMTFMAGFIVRERQLRGAADSVAPTPRPVAAIPPVATESPERDAWRRQLAAVPAEQKARLLLERLKKHNPGLDPKKVAIQFDQDQIVHVALHEGVYPDLTPLDGLVHLRSLWMDSGAGVATFEPLRGLMKLKYIHCPHNDVTDLSPLQGAPIDTLRIWGWKGDDLGPLRGMPIETLCVGHSNVSDLRPLVGMPLKNLEINLSKVSDLSPIAGTRLEELLMEDTLVDDLSIVRGMPLKNLAFRRSRVAKTDAIRGLPLKALCLDYDHGRDKEIVESLELLEMINLRPVAQFRANLPEPRTKVQRDAGRDAWRERLAAVPGKEKIRLLIDRLKQENPSLDTAKIDIKIENEEVVFISLPQGACADLAPIAGLPKLRTLWMEGASGVKTFEPLRGLPLESINCLYSDVTDLAPLQGMPLKYLCIWSWRGSDLSPLRGMALDYLNCGNSDVRDLTPLKGMPLTMLCVNITRVSDLSPLTGMKLRELMVENTMVEDIAVVRGMPLNLLTVRKTRVADVSPIHGLPLDHLLIDYDHDRHRDLIASLKSLEKVNQTPLKEFLAAVK